MVVVTVLLILARLLQAMRRISGVSRMTVPVKSLVSELATAAQEPATSNDRVGNELPAEPILSIMHKCVEFRVGQHVLPDTEFHTLVHDRQDWLRLSR